MRWLAALAVLAGLAIYFYAKPVPQTSAPIHEFIEGGGPPVGGHPNLDQLPTPQPTAGTTGAAAPGASPSPTPGATPHGAARSQSIDESPLGPPPALRPVREATPRLVKLREEAARNPHGTPPSLLMFSDEVGERVAQVRNEREATALFRELEECLVKPEDPSSHSVQGICLINARDLSRKFEGLRAAYTSLEKKSNPDVVKSIRDLP